VIPSHVAQQQVTTQPPPCALPTIALLPYPCVCAPAVPPLVLHNDAVCIGGVQDMLAAGHVHHIILSPGPGSPDVPQDIGAHPFLLGQVGEH
jgi:hypothetical protein